MAFVRYSPTGGIATAVHYGLLLVLVEVVHLAAGWAAALGARLLSAASTRLLLRTQHVV